MKLRAWVVGAGLTLVAGSLAVTASAAPKAHIGPHAAKDDGKKAKKPAGLPIMGPRGLRFGLSIDALSSFYSKVWDKEYLVLFRKAQPGLQMQSLENELKDKKVRIKRNEIKFEKLPTGVDQSPLKGHYSYLNDESMTRITLKSGTKRHFFFFKSRGLWKVYDEYKLRQGGPLGSTFEDGVEILTKKFGNKPKMEEPDHEKGVSFQQAVWTDNKIQIRLINRDYQKISGLVYVDKDTLDDLKDLRRNKPQDEGLDKSVRSVLKKDEKEGDQGKDDKKDDKKKK
jgi:hypothetical protein